MNHSIEYGSSQIEIKEPFGAVRSIGAFFGYFDETEAIYLRIDMIKNSDIDMFATFVILLIPGHTTHRICPKDTLRMTTARNILISLAFATAVAARFGDLVCLP